MFTLFDRRIYPGLLVLAIFAGAFFFWGQGPLLFLSLFAVAWQLFFFRDPIRKVPESGGPVSPADGKVVDISECDEPLFLHEKAVKIGIFLSVFNVHVNRSPEAGVLKFQKHRPGKYLNALKEESAIQNECNWMGLVSSRGPLLVRQISGAIARKIFWDYKIGDSLERGQKFGIICYGSRAELYVPKRLFRATVEIGQKVKAGESILGQWL